MFLWLFVVFILALILTALVLSRITIHMGFHRSPELQKVEAVFYVLKKVKVYQKIIILDKLEIDSQEEYKEYIIRKIEKTIEIVFKTIDTIHIYNDLLKLINKKLKKGFKIGKVSLFSRIGTGDAASTGLLCGLIWTVLGNLRIHKDSSYFFRDMDFLVCPDFNKKVFAVDIDGIFTIKTVYIIYVIRLVRKIFRIEKKRIGYDEEENDEKFLETG